MKILQRELESETLGIHCILHGDSYSHVYVCNVQTTTSDIQDESREFKIHLNIHVSFSSSTSYAFHLVKKSVQRLKKLSLKE
mmetsp:Transcript_3960/g.8757  ORF Transcript_3960/g.8757 Transcript_3960/m.8757 type:complete len:82 (-) Transcript_3960:72-317(-)